MNGSLSGYVLRGDDPVADAAIAVVDGVGSHPDIALVTDTDGWFVLDDLEPGQWRLRATAQDGASGEADAEVWRNSMSEVTIALDPALKPASKQRGGGRKTGNGSKRTGTAGRVVGHVTDSVTGHPVVGAPVVVTDGPGPLPDLAIVTDENGDFVIPEIDPGDWVITIDANGIGRGMLMVGVLSDRSVSVSLALVPDPTDDYWSRESTS